jgi:hypothetical protein
MRTTMIRSVVRSIGVFLQTLHIAQLGILAFRQRLAGRPVPGTSLDGAGHDARAKMLNGYIVDVRGFWKGDHYVVVRPSAIGFNVLKAVRAMFDLSHRRHPPVHAGGPGRLIH